MDRLLSPGDIIRFDVLSHELELLDANGAILWKTSMLNFIRNQSEFNAIALAIAATHHMGIHTGGFNTRIWSCEFFRDKHAST